MPPGDGGKPFETRNCSLVQEWWRKIYTVVSETLGVQGIQDLHVLERVHSAKHADSGKDVDCVVLNIN